MKVPFGGLDRQHKALASELEDAVRKTIQSSAFIGGTAVEHFEEEFGAWTGSDEVVACANGTDAIFIVLKALGVGPGDEVITTAHSWISTAEVVDQCGATVRFVDVDEYYHINADLLRKAITTKTKAIIGVHLFGQTFNGPALSAVSEEFGLPLIEDSAQAHGASLDGAGVGSWGVAATYSFFPGKNLGAWGDAGAITTSDSSLARACRVYARHGGLKKHDHEIPGINSRLDALQAEVLRVKLPHLAEWTRRRRFIAARYLEALEGLEGMRGLVLPRVRPGANPVWHLFVIQVDDRHRIAGELAERGISTGIHYPRALPFTKAYASLGYTPADLPQAWRNQDRILSLPLFPEMTDDEVSYVVQQVRSVLYANV